MSLVAAARATREQSLAELLDDGLFTDGDWVETKDQDPDGEVRLIQLADVGDGVFRDRSSRFLTLAKAKELRCTFLEPGDILVARMPEPLGRACVFPGVGQPAVTAVDVCILRPNQDRVRSEWLAKAINAPEFRQTMEQFVRGTTRQRISRKNLGTLPLAVPSVESQLELSNLLDSIEQRRGSAGRHVATSRRAIERFRQAVLVKAYAEAESTTDSRKGTRLEAILSEPFKNGYSARPVNHETPYRVLTLTATTSGWFDAKHFKYTDEEFPQDSPFWLNPGDIIIQRGNTAEYVGVPALYDGPPGQYLYPDLMIRARVRTEIDPRFVWYMLLASQARNFLRDRATGSAGNMPKINQKVLADVPVPIPGQDMRTQLVQKLDVAFDLADAVEQRIEVAARRVDRSSQAILAKAFRGEFAHASNGSTRDG